VAAELPNPAWLASTAICVGCDYKLEGLAAAGLCPECGAPFDAATLILYGVPRTSTASSPLRRLLWIIVVTTFIVTISLWPVLLRISGYLLLVTLIATVGGVIVLIAGSRRERSGIEKIVISQSHLVRVASDLRSTKSSGAEQANPDPIRIPWAGVSGFRLDRISSVWYRLRIGESSPVGVLERVQLDAGVRCPDAQVQELRMVLSERIQTARAQTVTPIASST
jgi:hypothetical protein